MSTTCPKCESSLLDTQLGSDTSDPESTQPYFFYSCLMCNYDFCEPATNIESRMQAPKPAPAPKLEPEEPLAEKQVPHAAAKPGRVGILVRIAITFFAFWGVMRFLMDVMPLVAKYP